VNYRQHKELQEMAALCGMTNHPLVRRFLNTPLLRDKPEWEERISKLLKLRMAAKVPDPHPFLPAPEPDEEASDAVIPGKVIGGNGVGHSFADPLKSFLQHKGIFGPAGSGKTMLSLILTRAAHRLGIAIWWFDSEEEISPLLAQEKDVLFLDVQDLRFNPFSPPPGCDARQYVTKLTSRFREMLYFRDGAVNLTRSICTNLLQEQGVFSLGDVYRGLLRMQFKPGRMNEYAQTCRSRFEDLLASLGTMIDVRQGHDLRRLLDCSVVWRLRGLSDDHLAFLVGCLLLWVEYSRDVDYS